MGILLLLKQSSSKYFLYTHDVELRFASSFYLPHVIICAWHFLYLHQNAYHLPNPCLLQNQYQNLPQEPIEAPHAQLFVRLLACQRELRFQMLLHHHLDLLLRLRHQINLHHHRLTCHHLPCLRHLPCHRPCHDLHHPCLHPCRHLFRLRSQQFLIPRQD